MSAAQEAARRYIRCGLAVVPVPASEKNPNRRGWQNERWTLEDVPRCWSNGQNVGLLTGEPSGGLVDVDLDCPEAIGLAHAFLPETPMVGGRESAPHSHHWFIAPGIESAAFKDTDGTVLVEIRADGRQTLVSPSVHPSGESYVWHGNSEPTEADPAELTRRIRELATATLLSRHVPPVGGRHSYALAVAGYLLRSGRLDQDTVLKVLKAAWYAAHADTAEALRDLEGIVRDTAEKIERGEPVTGGPTLEETAPGVVKLLSKWWGWGREAGPERDGPRSLEWPELDDKALHGLAGEIVRTILPHTEADKVALLISLLAAVGNAMGRGAYMRVGADRHFLNLNVGLVGETSKARKGMSWNSNQDLLHATDPFWAEDRIMGGLSSGEGLIYAVRDRRMGENRDGEPIVLDEGVSDKRLMIVEGEFAGPLKVATREGNTLSVLMRQAWDGNKLATLTKNSPLKATDAHVSIVGHITKNELLKQLSETDVNNGFANRFIWLLVRRSKVLPFGGEWHTVDVAPLVRRLTAAVEFGKEHREMRWGETARDLWKTKYAELSEGKPGLFGAATNRAEAQTLRLATLYAVLDKSVTIERPHLDAALTLWQYAEDSARYIFGDVTGDGVADRIVAALEEKPDGLTRTDFRDLFGRNKSRDRIGQALDLLERLGRVRCERTQTGGRPVERWYLA